MDFKPAADSAAVWDELAKQFEELDREEKAAPRERWLRVHASPAPGTSPNDPRTVYIVDHGIDALSRLKFINLTQAFGRALGIGSSPDAAFNAGMDRVWDDAISDKYEFLRPAVQFYSVPSTVKLRIEHLPASADAESPSTTYRGSVRWDEEEEEKLRQQLVAMTDEEREKLRVKRVGQLVRACQAAAISCRYRTQKALPTSAKKSEHRAARVVARRGDTKKADQRSPSLEYPRSPAKRAIRVILTIHPHFTDRQVCLQLDDDEIEVSSSHLKTEARSFQEMYDSGDKDKDKHKIEAMISDVRSRLRKNGLL